MPDRVGQQLGNYRLLRLLGRGGFAEVYLGEHIYLKRRAALKVLHTSLEDEDIDKFLAEAQILARLTHPNIVHVFDFAVEQGTPFLVMDYAPRGTLRTLHPPGSCLSLETTVAYVNQVAAALQYAHNHQVIHRDVKPENILLGSQQEVLLSDFGISLFAPSPQQLSTQAMAGTLPYMAPEQVKGKPSFASDQYSLGIIVYEWLCGKRPFAGSPWGIAYQQVSDPPPPLREQDPSLPQAVEEVVLKALAKDPGERYVSVQLFAQALERASKESQPDLHAETEVTAPLGRPSPLSPVTPTVTPRRVFLSAAHEDEPFVAQLTTDLQRRGMVVWQEDQESTQQTLEPENAVRQAIRAVEVVLLVVSPAARSSRTVKEHLRIASLYQRRLVFVWAAGNDIADVLPQEWGKTAQIDLLDARNGRYELALEELLASFEEEATVEEPTLPELAFEPRNPYKGLRAFREADATDFFGRESLIAELVESVKTVATVGQPGTSPARLLAVIGPSGSGKSSVVMAGLLPRLQQGVLPGSQQWVFLSPMVPGTHPLEALALTLASRLPERSLKSLQEDLESESARGLHLLATQVVKAPEQKVVLLIDQFEELFTLTTSEEERQHFIDLLIAAVTEPQGSVIVLFTLRADFYDRPMAYPALHRQIEAHQKSVLPMDMQDLRAVIRQPAALPDVQLSFEGSLIGDLLFEVQGQVGALPLLQFTLEQLCERRSGHTLTLEAYHEIGGVKGALAKQAEATYTALPSDEHRKLARALFLRLIDPGLTEQDTTRRRAALSEFSLADASTTRLLRETADAFISARLLTTNEYAGTPTIEVSHEAVIREWPRLYTWLREARQDIPLQQAITKDVTEWQQRGKPKDRLYRGSQLKEAQAWARRNAASGNEGAFLQASATGRMRSRIGILAIVLLVLLLAIPGGILVRSSLLSNVVTSLGDDGPGSLRQIIAAAKPGDTITFDGSIWGHTILLTNDLIITKQNLTIRGPGARLLTISNSMHQVDVRSGSSISISNLTFTGGKSNPTSLLRNEGMLTLTNSTISGNSTSMDGGGIDNFGTLTLTNSTISGNYTAFGGGGGIYNDGTLTLTNSTISGNSTFMGGGGGGIYNFSSATLTLTNSTISGNSTSMDGGGILIQGDNSAGGQPLISEVDLNFCTIYGNTAPIGGDIAVQDVSGTVINVPQQVSRVKIRNSIVAGDSAHPGPDISGMLTSYGYNLFQNNAGATFDPATSEQHGTDKTLSVNDLSKLFAVPLDLRDNGGPTRTYALAPGSPALDQIPLAACHGNGISTDQRGVKRPDENENACDIGAYESSP